MPNHTHNISTRHPMKSAGRDPVSSCSTDIGWAGGRVRRKGIAKMSAKYEQQQMNSLVTKSKNVSNFYWAGVREHLVPTALKIQMKNGQLSAILVQHLFLWQRSWIFPWDLFLPMDKILSQEICQWEHWNCKALYLAQNWCCLNELSFVDIGKTWRNLKSSWE